jgi:cytoskeletal protein RodZ
LREARERRQLSLSQVSQKIHVPVDFIGKAEAGQLDAFPPPVYSKSYLRQLAREYGLDAEPLLQEYLDFLKGSPDRAALPAADQLRLQAAAAEPAPAAPPPPDRKPFSMTKPSPSMIAVGIVLAGLLALAAAAFILNRGKTAPAATGPVPEPPPAATATATTGLDLERFITPEELPVKELPIPNR